MQKSFSDAEIAKYIPNVIDYNQLAGMSEKELLSKLPMVLLYLTSSNMGHWTLIHRVPGGIEFFDSYGFKPDREFTFISPEMLPTDGKLLAQLLYKIIQHTPIAYNQYQFQEMKPGVNTCGRHVIVRNMFSNVGIEDYKRGVDFVCNKFGITPDELVVGITS